MTAGKLARHTGEAQPSADGEAAAPRAVRITLDLSREQHRALRYLAADYGTTSSKILRAWIDDAADGGREVRDVLDRRLRH
jgi:hypothetical protein